MHKSGIVVLVVLSMVLLHHQGLVLGHRQYSQYEFPQLYTFDDYDRCFQKNTNVPLSTTYCMVYAEIKRDNSSDLWLSIQHHSDISKFNYRYDHLFFGICLDRCKMYAETSLTEEDKTDMLVNNEFTDFFEMVHKQPLDLEIRSNYSQMIYKCLNEDFEKQYNLKLKIFIEYCEGPNEEEQQIELSSKDPAESLLYKFIQIIILFTIFSSAYDYCLKSQQSEENQGNDFYINNLGEGNARLLCSFSIWRNYYRLVQPYRGGIGSDFSYLDAYRCIATVAVIYGHYLYSSYLHVYNPEYFEGYSQTTIGSMFLNAPLIIDIYMVMSGLFFYLKFSQNAYVTPQTSLKKCVKIFFLLFASRYLRYLPSVALLVLVNATILNRFVDGPFWRHISDQCRVLSRENGWKNILLINNFSQKYTASPHTWYLATDFQLFIFYAAVLIAFAKYPQYKSIIMKSLAILSVVIPTCVSYLFEMKSAFIIKGESYRHGYFTDPEFYYQYTPFYNHLGGYLFGIWCGELYLKHLCKPDIQKRVLKYELCFYVAMPIAYAILWLGTVMMFKEPSLWTAIYSGLYRNLWIVFVCGLPILGMVCKPIGYDFCCLPIFRVLARLTFQIFVWHLMILQMVQGYIRQPFYMNRLYSITLTIITLIISMIVAFFMSILVEYPFAQLIEALQPKRRKNIKEPPKETKIQ